MKSIELSILALVVSCTADPTAPSGPSSSSDGGAATNPEGTAESADTSDGSAGTADDDGEGGSSSTGVDERPPQICKAPSLPPEGPWFVEVTEELGLAATEDFEPLATGIVAADLDGDGWEDLVAATFPAQRQADGAPPTRFVLMNRPSEDGTSRRYVDATEAAGFSVTRDGTPGRGYSVTSLGDLDNDGDVDAVTCPGSGEDSVVDPCESFLNDGTGHFEYAPPSELSEELFRSPAR